jgi:hypothetical protein
MPDRDVISTLRTLAEREAARVTATADTSELRQRIAAGERAPSPRRDLRRFGRRAAILGAAMVVAGGGAAAAIWLTTSSGPEYGPVCRSSAETTAVGVVLEPGADPLTACSELWESGQLPNPDEPLPPGQPVPPLTACARTGGAVEVLPGDSAVCERAGLSEEPPAPSPGDAVLELQTRIVDEINARPCRDTAAVVDQITGILDESGDDSWRIVVPDEAAGAQCAKAAVDSSTRTITVSFIPQP